MVKYNNKKSAYTMLEACIVMLIISIFIAVTANVIPHRSKDKAESEAHGRFECYYNGSTLYQQQFVEGTSSDLGNMTSKGYCEFTPPKYIKFLIINAVGGASKSGGSTGEFASTFYSVSDAKYRIYPGRAGTDSDENGGPTEVKVCKDSTCTNLETALIAAGGRYTFGTDGYKNTKITDVIRCTVEEGPKVSETNGFNCGSAPMCEIEDNRIKVSFCRSNELYKTVYIPYKRPSEELGDEYYNKAEKNLLNTQYIVDSPYPKNNKWTVENNLGTLLYDDATFFSDYGKEPGNSWNPETDTLNPSLFRVTLTLRVDQNNADSAMQKYIDMLKLHYTADQPSGTGIKNANPGSISGGTSYPGGVLILW